MATSTQPDLLLSLLERETSPAQRRVQERGLNFALQTAQKIRYSESSFSRLPSGQLLPQLASWYQACATGNGSLIEQWISQQAEDAEAPRPVGSSNRSGPVPCPQQGFYWHSRVPALALGPGARLDPSISSPFGRARALRDGDRLLPLRGSRVESLRGP